MHGKLLGAEILFEAQTKQRSSGSSAAEKEIDFFAVHADHLLILFVSVFRTPTNSIFKVETGFRVSKGCWRSKPKASKLHRNYKHYLDVFLVSFLLPLNRYFISISNIRNKRHEFSVSKLNIFKLTSSLTQPKSLSIDLKKYRYFPGLLMRRLKSLNVRKPILNKK